MVMLEDMIDLSEYGNYVKLFHYEYNNVHLVTL